MSYADRMAFDRSVRSTDEDGRLVLEVCRISASCVSPYVAEEIPDFEALGLRPGSVHYLLRDPDELAKAAPTFNRVPVLLTHALATAADPMKDLVCGTTGSDAAFDEPWLTASMTIWDAGAIAGIETGEQRELSSAYRFVAVPSVGVYDGKSYTLRMTQIRGSHVALVPEGRVPGAMVGDAALRFPPTVSTKGRPNVSAIIKELNAIRDAEAEVAPAVGAVVGFDSLAGVYREALKRLGHTNLGTNDGRALQVMYRTAQGRGRQAPAVAMDKAARAAYDDRFPDAGRIKPTFR